MFKDLPEGQTHYQNDGCGMSEHNDMNKETKDINKDIEDWVRKIDEIFVNFHFEHDENKEQDRMTAELRNKVKDLIHSLLSTQ